jgi:hypothetical protein
VELGRKYNFLKYSLWCFCPVSGSIVIMCCVLTVTILTKYLAMMFLLLSVDLDSGLDSY